MSNIWLLLTGFITGERIAQWKKKNASNGIDSILTSTRRVHEKHNKNIGVIII